MNNKISETIFAFLYQELGLKRSSIDLGIKLSIINKTSLPISLWSNGLINSEELDKFYEFLYKNN